MNARLPVIAQQYSSTTFRLYFDTKRYKYLMFKTHKIRDKKATDVRAEL
jgi:hypothetical protein